MEPADLDEQTVRSFAQASDPPTGNASTCSWRMARCGPPTSANCRSRFGRSCRSPVATTSSDLQGGYAGASLSEIALLTGRLLDVRPCSRVLTMRYSGRCRRELWDFNGFFSHAEVRRRRERLFLCVSAPLRETSKKRCLATSRRPPERNSAISRLTQRATRGSRHRRTERTGTDHAANKSVDSFGGTASGFPASHSHCAISGRRLE